MTEKIVSPPVEPITPIPPVEPITPILPVEGDGTAGQIKTMLTELAELLKLKPAPPSPGGGEGSAANPPPPVSKSIEEIVREAMRAADSDTLLGQLAAELEEVKKALADATKPKQKNWADRLVGVKW